MFVAVLMVALGAQAETLNLSECIERALQHSPDVLAAQEEVKAAAATRYGALAGMGPRLSADVNVLRWNEPLKAGFGATPLVVRDPTTSAVGLTVTQPISGLWAGIETYNYHSYN